MQCGNIRWPRLVAAVLILAALLSAGAVHAEHEADHRYTIEGYVLDGQEDPQADLKVAVTADGGPLGQTVTDRRGYYRIQLHLHNTDLGRDLIVKAGDRQARIQVSFDPADNHTARVHKLNFVGAGTTQVDLGARGFPTWAYILIGAIVLLILARTISRALKQRRKMQARQQEQSRKKKRKKKRKRRR